MWCPCEVGHAVWGFDARCPLPGHKGNGRDAAVDASGGLGKRVVRGVARSVPLVREVTLEVT